MIVSKENIIKAGIDPSLVSDTDLIRIGDFVDKLNASKLDSLLQALDKDDDKVIKLKTFSLKVKSSFHDCLSMIIRQLDDISSYCAMNTNIFSTGLSPEITDKILMGALRCFNSIKSIMEESLDNIEKMYRVVTELDEIQFNYSRQLYDMGLLKMAISVSNFDTSEIKVEEVSKKLFDRFYGVTDFMNETSDLAVIWEKTIEERLPHFIDELAFALDFNEDGKNLNTKKVTEAVIIAKNVISSVMEL